MKYKLLWGGRGRPTTRAAASPIDACNSRKHTVALREVTLAIGYKQHLLARREGGRQLVAGAPGRETHSYRPAKLTAFRANRSSGIGLRNGDYAIQASITVTDSYHGYTVAEGACRVKLDGYYFLSLPIDVSIFP
jgi:hypothetical protein